MPHVEGTAETGGTGTRRTAQPAVRTLIVDHVEGFRRLHEIILDRDDRFEVVGTAGDGPSAIALAGALQPDLVLLDASMPCMADLAALAEVRAAAPHAAVVVLSSFPDDGRAPAARRLGAAAFLEKGLRPEELLAALAAVVDRAASPSDAADLSRTVRS